MDSGCSFEAANVALATPEPPFGGMFWKMVRSALLAVVDERNLGWLGLVNMRLNDGISS